MTMKETRGALLSEDLMDNTLATGRLRSTRRILARVPCFVFYLAEIIEAGCGSSLCCIGDKIMRMCKLE